MKKYIFIVIAVLLNVAFILPQMAVRAEEVSEEAADDGDSDGIKKDEAPSVTEGINHLQVPQKMQVVIDPWEMDGKSQVYSEQYIIKNTGETRGTLILSDIACKTGKNSGVTVKNKAQGLHDDKDKSVYIELRVGSKDNIILSQKGVEYKTEMNPGDELPIVFSGEVNENASKNWKDGDVDVTMTYAWDAEESPIDEEKNDLNNEEEETKEEMHPENSEEKKEEVQPEDSEEKEGKEDAGNNLNPKEEDEIHTVKLQASDESEIVMDSWTMNENENIIRAQYTMQNASETKGTLKLSELVCKTGQQSGIAVCTDKEALHDNGDKFVYMELTLQDGKKMVFSQENSDYEIELGAGEEVTFCLVGELNGINPKDLKEKDIEARVAYSWVLEETILEKESNKEDINIEQREE